MEGGQTKGVGVTCILFQFVSKPCTLCRPFEHTGATGKGESKTYMGDQIGGNTRSSGVRVAKLWRWGLLGGPLLEGQRRG